jgi:hypothetical protein
VPNRCNIKNRRKKIKNSEPWNNSSHHGCTLKSSQIEHFILFLEVVDNVNSYEVKILASKRLKLSLWEDKIMVYAKA